MVALSEKLKPVTEAQKRWAKKNCFDHNAYMSAGWLWCTECGKMWMERPYMEAEEKGEGKTVCPYCQAKPGQVRGEEEPKEEGKYRNLHDNR